MFISRKQRTDFEGEDGSRAKVQLSTIFERKSVIIFLLFLLGALPAELMLGKVSSQFCISSKETFRDMR